MRAHAVVDPGERAAQGVADAGEPVYRIVAIGGRLPRQAALRAPVETVVGERGRLVLAIRDREEIAVSIILRGLRPGEGIRPGGLQIPVSFRIDVACASTREAMVLRRRGRCAFFHPIQRDACDLRPIACGA